jgi:hypothetical protein
MKLDLSFVPASDYDSGRPSMTFAPRSRAIGLDEFPKTRAGLVDPHELRELARRVIEVIRPRLKARVASALREAKECGVDMSPLDVEDLIRTNCEPGSPLDKLYRETWGITMDTTKPAALALRFREGGVTDDEDDDNEVDVASAESAGDVFCSTCGRNSKGELAQSEGGLANFKGKKAPPFQREGALAIDFGAAERKRVDGAHLLEMTNPSLR